MELDEKSQELATLLESILDFKRWGFRRSYSLISHGVLSNLIYDSEQCRVRFDFDHWGNYPHPDIYLGVEYGRLHAPNAPSSEVFMTFNGEQCWCWHEIYNALRFLDGMTPKEVADELNAHLYCWPPAIKKFTDSDFAKTLERPEWEMRIEETVWEQYGKRLFDLFDLRQPTLWEKYAQFIKECYKLIGSPSYFDDFPPKDKIC